MEGEAGAGSDSSSFEDLSVPQNFDGSDETKAEDEWLDVLGSGSLKKKLLKQAAHEDTRPQRNDICVVRLEGRLENGVVVEKYDELEVQVGDMEVVQGLDLALPLMDVGEVSLFEIEPRLAYGDEGRTPDIPPNSKITYEVELIKSDPEPELDQIPIAKRKIVGNRKRERGNWWYSRNECNYAIQCYRRALDYLDDVEGGITDPSIDIELKPTDAELQDLFEDRMKVFNNMAAAQMKLQAYDAALKSVDNVLRCQPNNVKALFRKAKILVAKNEPMEATVVLKKALALEPTNGAVQQELQRLATIAQKHRNYERDMAKRMLQQPSSNKKLDGGSHSGKFTFWAPLIGVFAVGLAAFTAYKFKYD